MDYMRSGYSSEIESSGYSVFFDGNRVVVLLTGFLKKEQKTPQNEIQKALRLKKAYYDEKKD
jgi:phage-related protein